MSGARLRILYVEDDEVDRMALGRRIQQEQWPYELILAPTRAEADRLLADQVFDMALLDYRLPDGTAFDLLPHLHNTPGIVVTARGDEHVAAEALRCGAYDYLIKDASRDYLDQIPARVDSVMARRRAEEALIKSERRYRAIVEDQTEFICRHNKDGRLTFVNQAFCRYIGKPREEMLGASFLDLIHPDDRPAALDAIRSLTNAQPVSNIKHRVILPGGEVRWHRWTDRAIYDDRGRFVEYQSVGYDVTEHMEAQEREQELQARLNRSERMESLGLLAGGVAHDLNNLLGPMVAYPDLLLSQVREGSQEHEIIMEIKRSGARAAAVIRDLLTLARRGRFTPEVINLNDLVATSMKSAAFLELQKTYPEITLAVRTEPDIPNIAGSESNLLKVLMNLVINAFEAMPGPGTLTIRTGRQQLTGPYLGYESVPAGSYAILRVEDTGSGIQPADKNRIFEPFFTKKKMGRSGSGLGLSVVYGVIRDHRGYIDVQSQPGRGTAMIVFLPAVEAEVKHYAVVSPTELEGSEDILVVDDVPEQRMIATTVLRGLGYRVTAVDNGRAAVQLLKRRKQAPTNPDRARAGGRPKPFDLVVLDMIMEEDFDGLDTYQAIAQLFPGQKCVLVSGYSETERLKKAQALGAGRYLAKPYTREELGRAVREELGSPAGREAGRNPKS
jgi:two-component system cell cycle sensor histidine kinase/response regulator CckA